MRFSLGEKRKLARNGKTITFYIWLNMRSEARIYQFKVENQFYVTIERGLSIPVLVPGHRNYTQAKERFQLKGIWKHWISYYHVNHYLIVSLKPVQENKNLQGRQSWYFKQMRGR